MLKSIIEVAADLLDRELSEAERKPLGRHSLSDLWAVARPLLNPICERAANPPFPSEDLEGVDSYIRQLHEHDPDGLCFRYATTKPKKNPRTGRLSRDPSLTPKLKLVNIRVLAFYISRLPS